MGTQKLTPSHPLGNVDMFQEVKTNSARFLKCLRLRRSRSTGRILKMFQSPAPTWSSLSAPVWKCWFLNRAAVRICIWFL